MRIDYAELLTRLKRLRLKWVIIPKLLDGLRWRYFLLGHWQLLHYSQRLHFCFLLYEARRLRINLGITQVVVQCCFGFSF